MDCKSYSGGIISYIEKCRKLSDEKHLGHLLWENFLFNT